MDSQIDRPRLRFLEQDRGGLQRFAKAIEDIQFVGKIRAVQFARERDVPYFGPVDYRGPWGRG